MLDFVMSTKKTSKKQGKVRKNISLSPETFDMLGAISKMDDCTASAMLTRLVRDEHESKMARLAMKVLPDARKKGTG